MWRQPDFTPRATACDKPPEGQQVSSIASLLVMQFASQPICQQVSQFVPSLSASQSVCQPTASLSACPPARRPVCQQVSQSVASQFVSRFASKSVRQRFVVSLSVSQFDSQPGSQFDSQPVCQPASLQAAWYTVW